MGFFSGETAIEWGEDRT